jgi:hypothetical protein
VAFFGVRLRQSSTPLNLGPAWGRLPAEEAKTVLDLSNVEIGGELNMCCGFEADGKVSIVGTKVSGNYTVVGGRFNNPGEIALDAMNATIKGNAYLMSFGTSAGFQADGAVQFVTANVGGSLVVNHAIFSGKHGDRHGLFASGVSIKHFLIWQNVDLQNDAQLDLSNGNVGGLVDDEKSWPSAGNLNIEGLSYNFLAAGSIDRRARLRWLALQPTFRPQPYRELAKNLRENGDDAGAIEVLIAEEDARFRNSGRLRKAWSVFLNLTVGYGHKPLRSLMWSLAVILLGRQLVSMGARAGLMHATWPNSPPPSELASYEKLHPLLYSVDVFLPFVNLHQEHYWGPMRIDPVSA